MHERIREKTQRVRALAVLVETGVLFLTPTWQLRMLSNSSSMMSGVLSRLLRGLHACGRHNTNF